MSKDKEDSSLFTLNEKDFQEFAASEKIPAFGIDETKEQSNEELVRKYLPNVIAKKISNAIPDGFKLSQLQFTGELSGAPFGVGIRGSITATFTKV